MIYVFVFILMLFSWGVSCVSERLSGRQLILLWGVIVLFMIVISATRPDTGVSDLHNYEDIFNHYDGLRYKLTIEPTYLWLCSFINFCGGEFRVILWVYAILAIPLKIYAFKRLSSYEVLFAALPVYLSFFYFMHDCEQIRLAAAASFILLAYAFRVEEREWYTWVPLLICGIMFHYSSSIAIVPLMLYTSKNMGRYWKLALSVLVASGVIIWALKINIFNTIQIPGFSTKLSLYEMSIKKGEHLETIPLLYPVALLRYFTFFYVLYFYDTIRPHIKGLNIILIAEALGLFAWGGLSGVAVFAVRISEFYQITEPILFASVLYTIRPRLAGKCYPMTAATITLFYGIIFVNQFGYI